MRTRNLVNRRWLDQDGIKIEKYLEVGGKWQGCTVMLTSVNVYNSDQPEDGVSVNVFLLDLCNRPQRP